MKFPKTLTIRGEIWAVRLVSRTEFSPEKGREIDGQFWPTRREIRIWRGLKEKARWTVLLHEILHVCWAEAHGNNGTSISLEERLVQSMTEPLYTILHDNDLRWGKE